MIKRFLKIGILTTTLTALFSFISFAATIPVGNIDWTDNGGIYYRSDYALGLPSTWHWLNVEENNGKLACYYMDENGSIVRNTVTPDGYTVDNFGRWTVDGVVQTKEISIPYTKPELNREIYDANGLAYAVNDIMTMHPDESMAKYGATVKSRLSLDSADSESFQIMYDNGIHASLSTRPDGVLGYLGSHSCYVGGVSHAKSYFAYAPDTYSPASFHLSEAVKYYSALGYKHVPLTADIQNGEFYTINDIYPNEPPTEIGIVIDNYVVKFNYRHATTASNLTEILGLPISIWAKDTRIKFDLPYAAETN